MRLSVGVEARVIDDTERADDRTARFDALCREIEPRLRRALISAYGPELGAEATADALSWAWEHLDRVLAMANPAGYLWRVGQTSVRGQSRRRRWLLSVAEVPAPSRADDGVRHYEPALAGALADLSARQRSAVLLVHGYGYSLSEAADVLDCRIRTLRHHLDRGLGKLRTTLGADDG